MNYIGIDIGTTNIKIIEVDEKLNIIKKQIFEKQNLNNVLNGFIKQNNLDLKNIKEIVATGVGAQKLDDTFENIQVKKVSEFLSIAEAGKLYSNNSNFIVASIGTGTAFIKNEKGKITHEGGTGVGGGTLINLCDRIIPEITFEKINRITKEGNLNNVDLWIKDVTEEKIKTLPPDITAVNLGKLSNRTSNEDLIFGIVNMIFETVGVMAALIAKNNGIKNIVAIGQITKIPYAREVFKKIELLHNVKFIITENPEYMVALGAINVSLNTQKEDF